MTTPEKSNSGKSMEEILDSRFNNFEVVLKKMLEVEMSKMTMDFNDLKNSLQFLSEKYEEVTKENREMKEELESLKKENGLVKKELKMVQESAKSALMTSNDIDNHLRSNNVELHGVPLTKNENVGNVSFEILKVAAPNIKEEEIEKVHRIGNPKNADGTPKKTTPILVQLKGKVRRNEILKNRKKLAKHDFQKMNLDTERVFINENLSQFSKSLFHQANVLKKKNGWSYIWIMNGNINMRKSDGSQVLRIRDTSDLNKITK